MLRVDTSMASTIAMASKEDLSTKHQHARVDSTSEEEATTSEILPSSPPSFPDGGFIAWLQCAGSFFMFFNCWGLVNTFGESCSTGNVEVVFNGENQASFRLSINRSISRTSPLPISHGSAPSKLSCSFSEEWCPAHCMTWATSAT